MGAIQVEYQGDLRNIAIMPPTGEQIGIDEGKPFGGLGKHASPLDYLSMSVGVCAVSMMAMKAKEKGIEMKGTTVKIDREMTPDFQVAKIKVEIDCPTPVDESTSIFLEKVATHCPVRNALQANIQMEYHFKWTKE